VEEYLQCWSATEAARRAGYTGKPTSMNSQGSTNLHHPQIAAVIRRRMEEKTMQSDEVLARLDEIARGNITDFLSLTGRGFKIDIRKVLTNDKGHLIKSIKKGRQGTEIELYSALDALTLLGKHYRMFADVLQKEVSLNIEGLESLMEKIYGANTDDQS
jgi:hypothetical protein